VTARKHNVSVAHHVAAMTLDVLRHKKLCVICNRMENQVLFY
jgi:hypothetical protein